MNAKKLGFGLMRLPMLGDKVDVEQLKEMVDIFMERGFTYFDTAWMYCGFQSESAIKEALVDRYPRDSFTLTTKLHAGFTQGKDDRDRIFNEQLRKTGAGFFDYYLLHDLGGDNYARFKELDGFNWIVGKKEAGLIKSIGFSYHDDAELLDTILTEHPEFEFVQLQLNYLDWESAGVQSRKCYGVAEKHGKKVRVMEPVKGGTLAKVPERVEKMFKDYAPDMSVASWAVRFAASLENVEMVLSGMSDIAQMLDNTSYMVDFEPLSDAEREIVFKAVDIINESIAIPCTACSYCTSGCPMNIAIPQYFSISNANKQEFEGKVRPPQINYYGNLKYNYGKPTDCIECGQCEEVCPQHLPIREYLKEVDRYFNEVIASF